jgi:hypothetical protein
MQNKENMTGEESFELIRRMIDTAKEEIEDDSVYYLLWGWLVFISCMVQYVQIQLNLPMQGIAWAILMPLGGIITMIYARSQAKKSRKKSYIDDVMKYVIIAFLASLLIVLFFQSKLELGTYPMVMVIYGIWLFISGGALKFKPLIIGGIINWILAIVAFFTPFETQLLILALAVLLGYIYPGILLKFRFKRKNVV